MSRHFEDTFTLDDLAVWSEPGTHLAVLGHPVKHSLSPNMHHAALQAMAARDARFATWNYWKFDVPPERLAEALGLLHRQGFVGVNLTVPHKILALEMIAEVDSAARAIGAVNTLRRTTAGYAGANTDGYGLAAGIAEDLDCTLHGADVILLGAGGAARGAAVECLRQGCRSLWLGNRSRGSLDRLRVQVQPLATGIPLRDFLLDAPPPDLPAGALVINATSAGLQPGEPPPFDLRVWPRPGSVYDMVYNPPQTPLLAEAARLGIPGANGLSMLVHQGARALGLWTGAAVPTAEMRRAATTALLSRS
jgi:shikimate dehydrogenase